VSDVMAGLGYRRAGNYRDLVTGGCRDDGDQVVKMAT